MASWLTLGSKDFQQQEHACLQEICLCPDRRHASKKFQHYERDSEVASVVSSCLFLALSEELPKQRVPAATSTPTKVPDSGKSQSAALQSLPTP